MTASLRHHARFFDDVLDFVPAHLYLPQQSHTAMHGLSFAKKSAAGASSKAGVKSASKKARRERYNLDAQKPVAELQKRAAQKAASAGPGPSADAAGSGSESGHSEAEAEDGGVGGGADGGADRAQSLQELRGRLRAKVDAIAGARKARQEANREKQLKVQGKRAAKKEGQKKGRREDGARKRARQDVGGDDVQAPEGAGPAVQFGRVDLSTPLERAGEAGARKRRKRSLKAMLGEAEEKRQRLAALAQEEGGKEAAKAEEWEAALARAQGETVRDDPKLLRKAVKRRDKKKAKSAEAWQERKQKVAEEQSRRQESREANLKARTRKKMDNRMRKRGVVPPSGARPGFEGKKQTFINKKPKGKGAHPA